MKGTLKNKYPNDVWSALKAETDFVPVEIKGVFESNSKYQLLEVLVTRIFSLVLPEYRWKVTPIRGDQGIDFRGEQQFLDYPELDLQGFNVIIGQCKRRSRPNSEIFENVVSDVCKIATYSFPSQIIIAFAGITTKDARREAISELQKQFRYRYTFLGIEELDYLIRQNIRNLKSIIENALPDSSSKIIDHFEEHKQNNIPPYVHINKPEYGETGKVFKVQLLTRMPLPSPDNVYLRWEGAYENRDEKEVLSLKLISPTQATLKSGILLEHDCELSYSLELRFVCNVPRRIDLGKIILKNRSGDNICEAQLGEIKIAEQYHPIFFPYPYDADFSRFKTCWKQTVAGHVHVACVTGSGGAGKTRLCQEFGYLSTNDGDYISVRHPKSLDFPYRVFGMILRSLVPELSSVSDDELEIVKHHLSLLNSDAQDQYCSTIEFLFSREEHKEKMFDHKVLVRILALFLTNRSYNKPLLIHISDCHWMHKSIVNIFADLIERISTLDDLALTRIFFLFEGRTGETSNANSYSFDLDEFMPYAWEQFTQEFSTLIFYVEPFSDALSKKFLKNFFETSQSLSRQVPDSLISLQDTLIHNILHYAKGNPFHMIEQVKLLIDNSTIKSNQRTGLLYLDKRIEDSYEVPFDVKMLIQKRINYIAKKNRKLALFVKAIAFIYDHIDKSLFDRLKYAFIPELSESEILDLSFIQKSTSIGKEYTFRHENYFQVLNSSVLDKDSTDCIVKIYLEWQDSQGGNSPVASFERGMILEKGTSSNRDEIRNCFLKSLKHFESTNQNEMASRAVRHLLANYPGIDTLIQSASLDELKDVLENKIKLANFNAHISNWEYSARILEEVRGLSGEILRDQGNRTTTKLNNTIEYIYYKSYVELCSVNNALFLMHESINGFSEILPEIESRIANINAENEKWVELYLHGLNRLGIAFWFDGQHKRAISIFSKGYDESVDAGNKLMQYQNMFDNAMIIAHSDPHESVSSHEKVLEYLATIKHIAPPRLLLITEYHWVMAKVVALTTTHHAKKKLFFDEIEKLQKFLDRVYLDSRKGGYIHEIAGSALIAGVCSAIISSSDTYKWFMISINSSRRAGFWNFAWKAHLNLSQYCLRMGEDMYEAAGQHAEQAQEIIEKDMNIAQSIPKNGGKHRLSLYTLPIAQLVRIWNGIGDERGSKLMAKFHNVRGFYSDTEYKYLKKNRHEQNQVIHATFGQDDYFLMN